MLKGKGTSTVLRVKERVIRISLGVCLSKFSINDFTTVD